MSAPSARWFLRLGLVLVGLCSLPVLPSLNGQERPNPAAEKPKTLELVFTGLIEFVDVVDVNGRSSIRAMFPDFRNAPQLGIPQHFSYARFTQHGSNAIGRPVESAQDDASQAFVLLGSQRTEALSLDPPPPGNTKPVYDGEQYIVHLAKVAPPQLNSHHKPANADLGPGTAAYFDISTGTIRARMGKHGWSLCTLPGENCYDPECYTQAVTLTYEYPPGTPTITLVSKGGPPLIFSMTGRDKLVIELGNAMMDDIRNPMEPAHQYADPHFLLYYETLESPPDMRRIPFRRTKTCDKTAKLHGSNCPPVIAGP